MKILNEFFDSLDKSFKKLNEDIENELNSNGISIQESNGIITINKNGHLEIKGKIKSLTLNDKRIKIDE